MLTDLQKKAAQAVVNVFETGHARGEYGQVTLLPGDSGHLTYGRSQTTLASGNLFLLIKDMMIGFTQKEFIQSRIYYPPGQVNVVKSFKQISQVML